MLLFTLDDKKMNGCSAYLDDDFGIHNANCIMTTKNIFILYLRHYFRTGRHSGVFETDIFVCAGQDGWRMGKKAIYVEMYSAKTSVGEQ